MSACAAGCGLAAEPGDIYCAGDREAVDREAVDRDRGIEAGELAQDRLQ